MRLRSIREKFLAQDLCGGRSRGRVEGEHFIHDCAAVEWQHMHAESWCVREVSGGTRRQCPRTPHALAIGEMFAVEVFDVQ